MAASGIEIDIPATSSKENRSPSDREFAFEKGPWLLTQVILQDQSDVHGEMLWERNYLLHPSEKHIEAQGNLFSIENTLTGAGMVFVKRAPLPHARESSAAFDFKCLTDQNAFHFKLYEPELWSIIEYSGALPGRISSFHGWQRAQRPTTTPHLIPKLLCNTWGDRSRDSRVQEKFIFKEIEAAARLGAEVVQIDDGWQKGRSSNSAIIPENGGTWEGFWKHDPQFWEADSLRFPNGLQAVTEHAKKFGVEIGLWFAPDSSDEFNNWEKDVTKILELHKILGIRHFKFDGINARTPLSYKRLCQMLDAIQTGSQDNIFFDLDITAQSRPGYFGAMNTGAIFVENRYTDWHNYWPHHTLRTLWLLSRWIDPLRLRMELLNNSRNQDKYIDDPLAPIHYSPDTLFATVMFSNPLGWFEVSNLPEEYFQKATPLIMLWKSLRPELFRGTILPIGEVPDGVAWTGFISLAQDMKSGFVIVFRELNRESEAILSLPGLKERSLKFEILFGEGAVSNCAGAIKVSIPKKLGYVFAQFKAN
ncbi:MAG: hypothetical protein A2X49_11530 [Lentisphaerae bacterium GWF2_52_8]|nr:MAG: hypothetical protein A2X49_11530 [Lentisphaerae bacterium GWF2_52_8]